MKNARLDNFKFWYKDVMIRLFADRDAGFVILMTVFPLLERYLRQKVKLGNKAPLNDRFHDQLVNCFPELVCKDNAKNFWQVYRNGLLHEVTLSTEDRKGKGMPTGWLSNDKPSIEIELDGSFFLNPVDFAKRVLTLIEDDFSTFETTTHPSPDPLPTVEERYPEFSSPHNHYLGTRGGK
jgi:hypothetical protein